MPGATHSHSMVTVPATLIEGLEREVERLRAALSAIVGEDQFGFHEFDITTADGMQPHVIVNAEDFHNWLNAGKAAIASSEAEGGE